MTSIFSFRHTASFQATVLAALTLASPVMAQSLPASCLMSELATMPLTFTDDLRPVGQATINGNTVSAMLSTGSAEKILLNKRTLDRLGIKVNSTTSTQYVRDGSSATGKDMITRTVLTSLIDDYSFAHTRGKRDWFMVEEFMDDEYGMRLGAGNLLQQDLEIALDAGYLKLFKPDGCFREHLAYWDPNAVAVPTFTDKWKRDPRAVFTVRINGQDVMALLSTSTPHSYIPQRAAVRLGLTPDSPGATREPALPGDDPFKPVWNVPVAGMSIGALEVKDFNLRLMSLDFAGEILVLGTDFLHRHRVYIAKSQERVYFSRIDNPRPLKRGSVKVIPQSL